MFYVTLNIVLVNTFTCLFFSFVYSLHLSILLSIYVSRRKNEFGSYRSNILWPTFGPMGPSRSDFYLPSSLSSLRNEIYGNLSVPRPGYSTFPSDVPFTSWSLLTLSQVSFHITTL